MLQYVVSLLLFLYFLFRSVNAEAKTDLLFFLLLYFYVISFYIQSSVRLIEGKPFVEGFACAKLRFFLQTKAISMIKLKKSHDDSILITFKYRLSRILMFCFGKC